MTTYTFSVVATNSIGSGEAGVVMITTPGNHDVISLLHVLIYICTCTYIRTCTYIGISNCTYIAKHLRGKTFVVFLL